ncbi:MAG TPA: heavy metal translocating P-type ATPase [Gammaproteobacteria bacterium]|nr:heavy metal translocating P-type ATPase [Gammaproteobacteria bacterium]
MTESACFHCGEPLNGTEPWFVEIEGRSHRVCCPGCKAVAELIGASGLADFYRFRTLPAGRPADITAAEAPDLPWRPFDRPEMLEAVSAPAGEGLRSCTMLVEGVRCAACGWLIERSLEQVPGVREIRVNPASSRARLVWDPARLPLSGALGVLSRLGYRPHPGGAGAAEAAQRERRKALRRLGVAGIGMMQVMMYAVALWVGAFQDMDPGLEQLFRWVSMLVATPVALYSALPFYAGAWRDIRSGRPGMDVPVSLAIGGAWLASSWHTLVGAGEVYFESVTMFTFFLLLGRYLEMSARHRAGDTHEALARLLPGSARRRAAGGEWITVALRELHPGDVVSVRHGETLPADGRLLRDNARLDESMLTGESRPRLRKAGEVALAGSINLGDPLELQIERTGSETMVSAIGRLLDRAQSERPPIAVSADVVARWFVVGVLTAAALTWFTWNILDPTRAFEITLAVLVATCPCALSIATPAALTAATGFLARRGLLVTRAGAVEKLAHVRRVIFDKTGTLTHGRPRITAVDAHGSLDADQALAIAAALEAVSEHPIARAFMIASPAGEAREVKVSPGLGIEGLVDGRRWRLGRPDWAAAAAGVPPAPSRGEDTVIWLVGAQGVAAEFRLADRLRSGSRELLAEIRRLGLEVEIASGDAPAAVAPVAAATDVREWRGGLTPQDKLALLRARQAQADSVAMVGDGVNDAPVLAGADVSVAMAAGTPLAQTSADMVLLGESLAPLVTGVATARRTVRIVRQNLAWAAGYNLVALPLAAAGFITPWMAALGMSASSLLVVLNALRLSRPTRAERAAAPGPLAEGARA